MRLRSFQQRDLGQVYTLATRALNETYSTTVFTDISSYWPDGFIVLEEGTDVIGFIFGIMMSRSEARILMLAVEERYRMRGLGGTLYRAFAQECAVKGIRNINLEVRISNMPAIRFYQKEGFQIVGRLDRYYSNGEDAYRMQVFL
ncbi:MAG: ribosomal protein S18-alanine N-acetyltransferase [Methanomassiliicoccales archaeon]|jgi:ribosomal-protein-alanine N-acetyltransferase